MNTTGSNDHATHWEEIYQQKSSTAVSWYRDHLETSLRLLTDTNLGSTSRVIDVGGGASTLVDDLLDRGVEKMTVLDLSAASLQVARTRLGARAERVIWLTGDATKIALPESGFTHWHDRAVMHFLTDPADVRAYAMQAAHAIAPGGHAVIGGFAPDGPERCSGLTVVRRSAEDIAAAMSSAFELLMAADERHVTPGGNEQSFAYAVLRRKQSSP
jgi:SAM-dependent methyltransferase